MQAHTQAELAHASSTYPRVGGLPLVFVVVHNSHVSLFSSHGPVQGPLREFQYLMDPGALEAGKPSTSSLFKNQRQEGIKPSKDFLSYIPVL